VGTIREVCIKADTVPHRVNEEPTTRPSIHLAIRRRRRLRVATDEPDGERGSHAVLGAIGVHQLAVLIGAPFL
jgi:hypothetical protein